MNPRAYDPDDLRRLAGVATEGRPEPVPTPSADDRFRAAQFRALFETSRALPPESHARPYVEALPADPRADELVADWLDFLVRRVGRDGAADALEYYRRLRWLSDAATDDAAVHLAGAPDREPGDPLGADDHRLSLLYVSRLAAVAARR